MVSVFEQFLEESWSFIIIFGIIFIFILIYRDLGKYTRVLKSWHRASYSKILPKVMLTYQHFTRRGELTSLNVLNLYAMLRQEMMTYLQIKKGLSETEVEALVNDKKTLQEMFQDEKVATFLYSFTEWYALIIPKVSFRKKIFIFIKNLFSQQQTKAEKFYLELAILIRTFRKALLK